MGRLGYSTVGPNSLPTVKYTKPKYSTFASKTHCSHEIYTEIVKSKKNINSANRGLEPPPSRISSSPAPGDWEYPQTLSTRP